MIRQRHKNEFWLVTQNDHALAAGVLAAHIGGELFALPSPYLQTLDAIALHDSGWIAHDEAPTLNNQGIPLHVFETPPALAVTIWSESVQRAMARDTYSGLLVSLHVLRMASLSMAHWQHASFPTHQLFELTRFQHAQVELQETLRSQLGIDQSGPLTLGLGKRGVSSDEDLLLFNAGLLRFLDTLSLDLCGIEPPIETVDALYPRPGAPSIELRLARRDPNTIIVAPWPFDVPSIELKIPFRRFPAERFSGDVDFQEAYAAAPIEQDRQVVAMTGRADPQSTPGL